MGFTFVYAEMGSYAKYYSIYADYNIFISDDWNERIERLSSAGSGYFVLRGSEIIGGFILNHDELSYPFMVPPFSDRQCFWECVLNYSVKICKENCIKLKYILLNDEQVLVNHFYAALKLVQRMMMPLIGDSFYLHKQTLYI